MLAKIHEMNGNTVLACCDKSILGKNLREGNYDVTVDESFYAGKPVGAGELAEMMKEHANINLFGDKAVGVALEQGLISESDIIRIEGVKHAVIMKV